MKLNIFKGLKTSVGDNKARIASGLAAGIMVVTGTALAEVPENSTNEVVPQNKIVRTINNDENFYIGMPKLETKARQLSVMEMETLAESAGMEAFYPYNAKNPSFRLTLGDETYIYRPKAQKFSSSRGEIMCKFYASTDNFENIDNFTIIIGGDGLRTQGGDITGASLNTNSIAIVCFSGSRQKNMMDGVNAMVDCAKLASYIFAKDKEKVCINVIGTSEGGQAASVAGATNADVLSSVTISNGAAYWEKMSCVLDRYAPNKQDDYKNFCGLQIFYMSTKSNNTWNEKVIRTISDLLTHGVSPQNIHFFTNDRALIEPISSLLGPNADFNFLENQEKLADYGKWENHGSGYPIIVNSEILSYISSEQFTQKYGKGNQFFIPQKIGKK